MGANTKIEWADHTFNPWRGCVKVSEACRNCYAEKQAKRNPGTLGLWGSENAGGTRVVAAEAAWREPLKWDREAKAAGVRHRVFCASMADVFEDWQGPMVNSDRERLLRNSWREVGKDRFGGLWYGEPVTSDNLDPLLTMQDVRLRLFELIDATPNLDWLLLTKRPHNLKDMLPTRWLTDEMPPNVWIGTTVENQQTADERIPHLLRVPAKVRFLSCEPLLGPVDLTRWTTEVFRWTDCDDQTHAARSTKRNSGIHWVIAGGESGPHARPSHPDWFRSLLNDCATAGVPFFFKQWGEWERFDLTSHSPFQYITNDLEKMVLIDCQGKIHAPWAGWKRDEPSFCEMVRVGKSAASRLLDGREWNEAPQC